MDAPDIPISFGICVGPTANLEMLRTLIASIRAQMMPYYEIILIGDGGYLKTYSDEPDIRILEFDENERPGWISRKKNLIVKNARYDVLCIISVYHHFDVFWYDGVKEFIAFNQNFWSDWDIIMNPIINTDTGKRGIDWVFNPFYMQKYLEAHPQWLPILREKYPEESERPWYVVGIPYNEAELTRCQYISGGFIFCKKKVLETVPLNEDMLLRRDAEDIDWSERLKKHPFKWKMNLLSISYIQEPKRWNVCEIPKELLEELKIALKDGFFDKYFPI